MVRGDVEKRNKRKNKFKEKKRHPYKKGGGKRGMNLSKEKKSK